jgi:hypothetical protein
MIDTRFVVGGYAVSPGGFYRIEKRTAAFIWLRCMTTKTYRNSENVVVEEPGTPEEFDLWKTKVLQDDTSEFAQWGRARWDRKWRPWNGQPVPYRLMTPETWPHP